MAHMTDFSTCPKTHPILLPQLMYQAEFHLGDIPKNAKPSDFILSNGDDSMASFHADFIRLRRRALVGLIVVYTRQRLCHVSIRWQAGEPDLTPIKTMPNEVVDNIKTLLLGSPVDTDTLDACKVCA
jgi:hypothetical protein